MNSLSTISHGQVLGVPHETAENRLESPLSKKTSPEQIHVSSPMRFFSMLNEIEDRISREALASFAGRQWRGSLQQQDWEQAERRLLDQPLTRITPMSESLSIRIYTCNYEPQDIAIHVEGDFLCVCAQHEESTRSESRMLALRLPLPHPLRNGHVSAWVEPDSISVLVTERHRSDGLRSKEGLAAGHSPRSFNEMQRSLPHVASA